MYENDLKYLVQYRWKQTFHLILINTLVYLVFGITVIIEMMSSHKHNLIEFNLVMAILLLFRELFQMTIPIYFEFKQMIHDKPDSKVVTYYIKKSIITICKNLYRHLSQIDNGLDIAG